MSDAPNEKLIAELLAAYRRSAKKLRAIVLDPPGALSMEFNRQRAQTLLGQVQQEVAALKKFGADWTGRAIEESTVQGISTAMRQILDIRGGAKLKLEAAGAGFEMTQTWSRVNHEALRKLAADTVTDLAKGATGMGKLASGTLNSLAGLTVTKKEVNDILAGRLTGSETGGSMGSAYRQLRDKLKAVHGAKVVIPCKDGVDREYDSEYYAEMISRTKTRQAIVEARHSEFEADGVDLVRIVGRISPNFCTAYVGKVFSLSGKSGKYPSIDSCRVSGVPAPGPPFHPNCSKSSIAYIDDAAADEARKRIAERLAAAGRKAA